MPTTTFHPRETGVAAGDLRVDGWLVQPALNLLTRDHVRVRVRAQLMDLLVCLASRPGKVFHKDELLAEVWEGRWVAESALSRCVAELRSALGDEAQRPRVIETIIKRGYRLIAPVELVAPPRPAPSVDVGKMEHPQSDTRYGGDDSPSNQASERARRGRAGRNLWSCWRPPYSF